VGIEFQGKMQKNRKEYNEMLKSGELEEMYPWLSGSWSEDRLDFELLQDTKQEYITNWDLDDQI
jgi:hypothetical protein